MTLLHPTPSNLTDLLLQTLANIPAPADPTPHLNPTHPNLTPAKPTLLTLHALYPTTLLPALDVLDRRLITRLDLRCATPPPPSPTSPNDGVRSVYYVRSAAPSSSRRGPHHRHGRDVLDTSQSYEVRTQGWSCTCAAFAFAAFGQSMGGQGDPFAGGEEEGEGDEMILDTGPEHAGDDMVGEVEEGEGNGDAEREDGRAWGGLMRVYEGRSGEERGVPVCKHLLACVLAEWWDLAGQMVEVRTVDRGEMAGWAGGWGG